MTKSATATPGLTEGQVSTVNIDGSWETRRVRETHNREGEEWQWWKWEGAYSTTHSMVKWYCVDDHEVAEVILVLVVVTIPIKPPNQMASDPAGFKRMRSFSVVLFSNLKYLGIIEENRFAWLSQRVVGRAKWPEGPTDNPWRCSYQWQPAEEKDKGSQWWYRCSYVVRTSPVFLASGEQFCLSEVRMVLTLVHC